MKSSLLKFVSFFLSLSAGIMTFQSCTESTPLPTPPEETAIQLKVTFAPIEVKTTDGKITLLYSVETANFEKDGYKLMDFQVTNSANGKMLCALSDTGKYLLIHKPIAGGIPEHLYSYPLDVHATYRFSVGLILNPADVPQKIMHRLVLLKDSKERIIESAETFVSKGPVAVISPPLKGEGFLSACTTALTDNHHPTYQISYKGITTVPERFCVDWLKVDSNGNYFHGDKNTCTNWYVYGQNVYAASSGQVVFVNDGLPDQSPVGSVSSDINIFNGTGNTVVISSGVSYTLYGHMIPNSIVVKTGQYVTVGQLIGKVGNSGNSSAPHLHFGVHTEFPYYNSEGLPYYIDSLEKTGIIINPTLTSGTLIKLSVPEKHTNELLENWGVYNLK
jgi:hypothetical protein